MALGICHKNTVKKKNYQWSTPLGHGGYLISSQVFNLLLLKNIKAILII